MSEVPFSQWVLFEVTRVANACMHGLTVVVERRGDLPADPNTVRMDVWTLHCGKEFRVSMRLPRVELDNWGNREAYVALAVEDACKMLRKAVRPSWLPTRIELPKAEH